MRYTLEFKLECVEKRMKGIHIDLPEGLRSRVRESLVMRPHAQDVNSAFFLVDLVYEPMLNVDSSRI